MIFTLILAIALSLLVIWFVLSPLFVAENMEVFSASYKGFSDEVELRQALNLRDQLLSRLTTGQSSEQRLGALSDTDCFDALVSLCLRLQRAELPFLPQNSAGAALSTAKSQKGSASLAALLLVGVCALLFSGIAKAERAQESLHILEPGVFLPTSSRYIVSPAQSEIVAHYVTSFAVPSSQGGSTMVVMAVPEDLYDWQIVETKPEQLAKSIQVVNWNGLPAVVLPEGSQGLAVTISSDFRLRAPSGRAVWKNSKLAGFPGEQVAILFEVPAPFKGLFGSLSENWNVWPPRIANAGLATQVSQREVQMNPSMPPRRVQIVNRGEGNGLPFFSFEVIGVVPNRMPLIILGSLVGAVLFGVALTLFVRRARWRIDAPESLPQ
ncbi:MAG: hypothetical protein RLZZ488_996 [Pseudomonadota bacterium]|jgi:hypothetical protein